MLFINQGVTKEDIERAEETLKMANRGPETASDKSRSKHSSSLATPTQGGDTLVTDWATDDRSDKENSRPDGLSLSSSRNKRNAYSSSEIDKKEVCVGHLHILSNLERVK